MSRFSDAASFSGASWFNINLAEFLSSRYLTEADDTDEILRWLLLHVSQQASAGHMRTDLHGISKEMPDWYRSPEVFGSATANEELYNPELPDSLAAASGVIIDRSLKCGLATRLAADDSTADELPVSRSPLLLSADGRFLYLLKRRRAEDFFLSSLAARLGLTRSPAFPLPSDLPETPDGELMKRLSDGARFMILSGGPGTGKTTTIASLLNLIRKGCSEAGRPIPRIFLTAPTGRAAARLGEALGDNRPEEEPSGRTLHSLLGISPNRPPKHNSDDPLAADLVIVDEASMVDLSMMNRLIDALTPSTSLLLVGDPDQLPSVEAGALLGDLLAGASEAGASSILSDAVTTLETVYRSDTAILDAASAVKSGDIDALDIALVHERVRLFPSYGPGRIAEILTDSYRDTFTAARNTRTPDTALLESFAGLGVLTPLRRGPWGVSAMNDRVSFLLEGSTSPFAGMPIMVTGNDTYRNLWNGDRGVLVRNGNRLRACFPGFNGIRSFPLAALPGWEPAWVQTIHKSQGSEFDRVMILLPPGAEKLLTREILYTALTRARHTVDLYTDRTSLETALSRKVLRNSRIRTWSATCPRPD